MMSKSTEQSLIWGGTLCRGKGGTLYRVISGLLYCGITGTLCAETPRNLALVIILCKRQQMVKYISAHQTAVHA